MNMKNLMAFSFGVYLVTMLAFSVNANAAITTDTVTLKYGQRIYPDGSYKQGDKYIISGNLSGLKIYADKGSTVGWQYLVDGDNYFTASSSVYLEKLTAGSSMYQYNIKSNQSNSDPVTDSGSSIPDPGDSVPDSVVISTYKIELLLAEQNRIIMLNGIAIMIALGFVAGNRR